MDTKSNQFNPDYVASPGEVLQAHMDAKGLTINDVADICDCSRTTIIAIIAGAPVSVIMCQALATATGTSPQMWRNLERAYRSKYFPKSHS